MTRRVFFAAALLVTLAIAGFGSYYASGHPDGLEYVAERTGFLESAEDSPTAGSPLSDYRVAGIDDARLSGGLAGVLGVGVTLLVGGGLFWAIRRRDEKDADEPTGERSTPSPAG